MSQISKNELKAENQLQFPNNNNGAITPSRLRAFNVDMIDSTVNQSDFTSFSGSVAAQLAAATGSVTSAITGSSLITASFDNGTRNLTFTKGDASTFAVNIPDVSGSSGNFVTTSSFNAYTASNDQRVSSLEANSASVNTSITALNAATSSYAISSSVAAVDAAQQAQIDALIAFTGSVTASIDTGSFATTGSNTFNGNQIITGSLSVNGSPSTFITNGNTDLQLISTAPSGQTNIVLNAFQNNIASTGNFSFNNYGQFGGSGSVQFISTLNNISFASDSGTRVGPTNGGGNGINTQAISLQSHSGSLSLAPSGFSNTTASLSHISSSSGTNFVNLMFKNNSNTITTIVSGSNNIFANPVNVTAGFVRYVGGNNNIYTNVLPQLTGSAVFPILMANNISNSGMLFRAPVSSSAYTISSNLLMNGVGTALNFGSSAANNFERAVSGLNIINNIIAGAINATAAKTTLSASTTISANNIGGTITLNYDSSSINLNGTTVQGGLTVNNSYFPSTINTNSLLGIAANLYIGSNSIYASGSNDTFTAGRTVANTSMIGNANVISASLNGDNTNVNSTILLGQALTVVGSNSRQAGNTMPDYGSVFVGRWNDLGGTKDQTAETVFAVGTGTGEATRKTGFLIDSGSNTFVEGTLNMSGSSTFNGQVTISSSAANDLVVNGRIFVSSSATSGTGTPQITVSGSAGSTTLQRNAISTQNLTLGAQLTPLYVLNSNLSTFDEIGFSVDVVSGGLTGWSTGSAIYVNDPTDSYPAMFGFQNKANWTDGRITALKPLVVSGSLNVLGNSTLTGSLNIAGGMNVVSPGGQTARFTSIDTTTQRIKETLAFTGSRFVVGALSTSVDMENLSSTIFGFNQLDTSDGNTGAQFLLQTNKASNYSELKLNARYTGSNNADVTIRNTNTGASTFTVNATTSTLNSSFYIQSSSVNLPTSTGSAILTWNASTGQVSQASFSSIVSASVSSAEFWSTTTQSGSAGVSGSVTFNNSGSVYGVSLVNGKELQVANAGVYNIQFSAQIETSAGADTIYVWFKKNGTNIGDSASKAVLANNTAQIMTVNILDQAVANDYYEIAYQTLNGNARILAEAASGNIPAIPSVITTITQVR